MDLRKKNVSAIIVVMLATAVPAFSGQYDCVIHPSKVVEIGSPVTGLLSEVSIDTGDIVAVGSEIARLDSRVEETTVDLARVRSQDRSGIEAQEAQVALLRSRLLRAETLLERKAISVAEFEQRKAELAVGEAELVRQKMSLRFAELELARAQASLSQKSIVSPLTGVIIERRLSAGEFMRQESSIAVVAQLDPLYVKAYLPSDAFDSTMVGATARVYPAAVQSEPLVGIITLVDQVFDATSNTFGIRVEIENSGSMIPAGQRCQISID